MSRTTYCDELIVSTTGRRGNGITTPIRGVTEIFTKEGKLIAVDDPYLFTIEEIFDYVVGDVPSAKYASVNAFIEGILIQRESNSQ